MAEVYWIRLPEHTDMFTQGYIGVTKKTAKQRWQWHVNSLSKKAGRSIVQNVIAKYRDSLIVETLVICDMNYAYELEEKLRPSPKIGWNIRMGGNTSEAFSKQFKGRVDTEEAKRKRSQTFKSLWKEERQERLKPACDNRQAWSRPLDVNGAPTRFWTTTRIGPHVHYWEKAQECRDVYDNHKYCSTKEIADHFGLEHYVREWFQPMLRYFDGGWIPKNDPLWCQDYNFGSDQFGKHKILPVDWTFYKSIWKNSHLIYEMFLNKDSACVAERKLKLPRGKLYRMYEYFEDGWIPDNDPIWVSTCKEETPLWDTH